MFRANYSRTGVYEQNGVQQLRGLKWSSVIQPESTFPSSVAKLMLAASNNYICVVSESGYLKRFDAETGAIIWQSKIDGKVDAYPVIYEGILYIISQKITTDVKREYLYAIELNSGREIWKYQIYSLTLSLFDTIGNFFVAASSDDKNYKNCPIILNNIAYISSSNNNLYAIDITSHREIWCFETNSNSKISAPAIANELIFIDSADGYLYAIDTLNGIEIWNFNTGGKKTGYSEFNCPVVANSKVYVSNGEGKIYALNLNNGEIIWTFLEYKQQFFQHTVTKIVVCFGSYNSYYIYALNANTGEKIWTYKTNALSPSSPIIANNIAYIQEANSLMTINLNNREEVWKFGTQDTWENLNIISKINNFLKPQFSEPVIINENIYTIYDNKYLYCIF